MSDALFYDKPKVDTLFEHLSTDNLYNGNDAKVVPLSDKEVRTGGDVWTYHEIPPYSSGLAYGNGVLVAADFGPESGIWYSEDLGANWTKSPETDGIRVSGRTGACAFGNGTFVVVQDYTTTWTSQDGKHWNRHSIGVEIGRSVFFCNGMFLSSNTRSPSQLYVSSDGIDWSFTNYVPTELTKICYGDGVYVASNNARIFRSTDLTDGFSEITGTSFTGYVNGLVYGGGRFVISYAGNPDGLWYSDDKGLTWKPSNKAGTYTGGVVYGDGRFVAADDGYSGFSGKWYSDDGGETWTHFENSDSSGLGFHGVYADGRFIFTYSSNSDFSISDRMSVSRVVPVVQGVKVNGTLVEPDANNIVDISTGPGGEAQWGSITGTLSDQEDLSTALSGKLDTSGGTVNGDMIFGLLPNGSRPARIRLYQYGDEARDTILYTDWVQYFGKQIYWPSVDSTDTFAVVSQLAPKANVSDFNPPAGSAPASYVANFVQKCATILAPNFSESTSYAVGNFCTRMDGASPKIYQCTTAHTGAWNAAHFAERDVSALFSAANTANNLDNIRTSASDATTAAATIAGKLDKVGSANYGTKVFWNSDGDTLNIKGNMRVNVDGDFAGLYVPQAQNVDDDEVWNIGQIRGEIGGYSWDWSSIYNTPTTIDGYGITDAAKTSDIPSLAGQIFDLANDAQFKRMCVAVARALGATVLHGDPIDDNTTGEDVALMYGITPTDATTYGDIENKAGLNDSDTPGDL